MVSPDCPCPRIARIASPDCESRSAITPDFDLTHGLDDAALNEVYNLFDVFVLPSSGEGFGLPLIEAMAAGVPVITTNASSNKELVEGRGLLIDVKAVIIGVILNLDGLGDGRPEPWCPG